MAAGRAVVDRVDDQVGQHALAGERVADHGQRLVRQRVVELDRAASGQHVEAPGDASHHRAEVVRDGRGGRIPAALEAGRVAQVVEQRGKVDAVVQGLVEQRTSLGHRGGVVSLLDQELERRERRAQVVGDVLEVALEGL